jgi:hypothetical protein
MPALSKGNMGLGSKLAALCIPYVGLPAGRCQEMKMSVEKAKQRALELMGRGYH